MDWIRSARLVIFRASQHVRTLLNTNIEADKGVVHDMGEGGAAAFQFNDTDPMGQAQALRLVEEDLSCQEVEGHNEEECRKACLDFVGYVVHQISYNAMTDETS